ncbi:hypothetical protein N2152v2_009188 [Parachlorella kessleri]
MLVALTSLSSLLTAFQEAPRDADDAREAFWEARVFLKAISAVSAHDASSADPLTAAELLGLAAQASERIVQISEGLSQAQAAAVSSGQNDALRILAFEAAAVSTAAHGILALLQLPFVHDGAIAERLAASGVVAVEFQVPQVVFDRGLAGAPVLAAILETARHAVEIGAQACSSPQLTSLICKVVTRPGVLLSLLQKAVDASQACLGKETGSREAPKVREHLAYLLYLVLTEPPFHQEAQRVLGSAQLLHKLAEEVALWRVALVEHAEPGSRDWRGHIEVARALEGMQGLQLAREASHASMLLNPEDEEPL